MRLAAHNSRAVWENFPGFTADMEVSSDGAHYSGKIRVAGNFKYELNIADEARAPWVKAKLRSVISHRRPSNAPRYAVHFADNQTNHTGGRLIAEDDGSGMFRIKNGVISEVVRKSESSWFEISNIEQLQTHNGQYLPRFTSVVYRHPQTGDIQSNRSNLFTWKRVGDFYLPASASTVEVGSRGERSVRKIVFTNHKLAKAPAK